MAHRKSAIGFCSSSLTEFDTLSTRRSSRRLDPSAVLFAPCSAHRFGGTPPSPPPPLCPSSSARHSLSHPPPRCILRGCLGSTRSQILVLGRWSNRIHSNQVPVIFGPVWKSHMDTHRSHPASHSTSKYSLGPIHWMHFISTRPRTF